MFASRIAIAISLLATSALAAQGPAKKVYPPNAPDKPKPPVVTPAAFVNEPPPADAIVLFDGKDLSQWASGDSAAKWIVKDGYMEVVPGTGSLRTKRAFGDVQLHIEFRTPTPPHGESQERGNSGVFLMGHYEIQVLDVYHNDTYADGYTAAVYGQTPPLVNAARPPGEWQSYDIVFHRPHFNTDGSVETPARVTVFWNGLLAQDNTVITGWTVHNQVAKYQPHADQLPLMLQDHENPTRFRNVWVRELQQ